VVARAWNIPAVCGVTDVELTESGLLIAGALVREGDIISIDGETGAVYLGPIAAAAAADPYLEILRDWAAEVATVG
jgi:pyruvate,orthophosphate dikinase